MACRLPRGVPLRRQIFLSSTPGCRTSCKPHKHDDVFPLRRTKSPSLTFNLVGRRLCSAKRAADTLPCQAAARRFIVACRRKSEPHRLFCRKKYLNAPLPPNPPPIIPPLPVWLAAPAESKGASIANPSRSRDGNAEGYVGPQFGMNPEPVRGSPNWNFDGNQFGDLSQLNSKLRHIRN